MYNLSEDAGGIWIVFSFIIELFLSVGDIIIKEGTIGTKMYFIQEGVVDIVMANGEVSTIFTFF